MGLQRRQLLLGVPLILLGLLPLLMLMHYLLGGCLVSDMRALTPPLLLLQRGRGCRWRSFRCSLCCCCWCCRRSSSCLLPVHAAATAVGVERVALELRAGRCRCGRFSLLLLLLLVPADPTATAAAAKPAGASLAPTAILVVLYLLLVGLLLHGHGRRGKDEDGRRQAVAAGSGGWQWRRRQRRARLLRHACRFQSIGEPVCDMWGADGQPKLRRRPCSPCQSAGLTLFALRAAKF